MKICFISSLFSDDYTKCDKPQKFKKYDNCDYFLFTNIKKEYFSTSWEIINIDDNNPIFKGIQNNIIKSRYPKFMGWKYLKDNLKKNYDVIFYCDCILYPRYDIN